MNNIDKMWEKMKQRIIDPELKEIISRWGISDEDQEIFAAFALGCMAGSQIHIEE